MLIADFNKLVDAFCKRVWYNFALLICILAVVSFCSGLVFDYFQIGWDNSDSQTERSGLDVKTDHLTGCQYLVTSGGGITPRFTNQECKVK